MPTVYEVYDVGKSTHEPIARYFDRQSAVDHANGICSVDQFTGTIEVIEVDEDPIDGRGIPQIAYTCRG
jgi:hypothetical protein